MKVKKYSRMDCKQRYNRKPTVRFSTKGTICFSKSAMKQIGLKKNDKIFLIQDEDQPRDWYIEKTKDQDGLTLRLYDTCQLITNASAIVRQFLSSLDLHTSTTFLMATKPTEEKYYAIITRSAEVLNKKPETAVS